MNKKLLICTLIALPMSLFFIGCGSGSSDSGTTTASTSGTTGTVAPKATPTAKPETSTTSMNASNSKSANSGKVASNASGTGSFKDVESIVSMHCAGCHSGPHPADGIDLTSYQSMVSHNAFVAGNPETSKIYEAVMGTHGITRMPKGQPKLSDKDIQTIKNWIASGAKSS